MLSKLGSAAQCGMKGKGSVIFLSFLIFFFFLRDEPLLSLTFQSNLELPELGSCSQRLALQARLRAHEMGLAHLRAVCWPCTLGYEVEGVSLHTWVSAFSLDSSSGGLILVFPLGFVVSDHMKTPP